MRYEEEIIKDTKGKSYSEMKRLHKKEKGGETQPASRATKDYTSIIIITPRMYYCLRNYVVEVGVSVEVRVGVSFLGLRIPAT